MEKLGVFWGMYSKSGNWMVCVNGGIVELIEVVGVKNFFVNS